MIYMLLYQNINESNCLPLWTVRALHVFAQLKQMQNFHESKSVPLHV